MKYFLLVITLLASMAVTIIAAEPQTRTGDLNVGKEQPDTSKSGNGKTAVEMPRLERAKQLREKWQKLTPEQKETAKTLYRKYQKLPPEDKQKVQEAYKKFRKLPPEKQAALKEKFQNMSPEKKQ
ncbi:MAG: DUF3106 domain-containing protein, partial [Planctomycetes bacterium]|nr:DUF3106 domain-containing protein [Planctomycetota bacterium]